jgi:hypothetical protein
MKKLFGWFKPTLRVNLFEDATEWVAFEVGVHLSQRLEGKEGAVWRSIIEGFTPDGYEMGVLVCGEERIEENIDELKPALAHFGDKRYILCVRDRDVLEELAIMIPAYDTQSLGALGLCIYQGEEANFLKGKEFFEGKLRLNEPGSASAFRRQFYCLMYSTEDDPTLWVESAYLTFEQACDQLRRIAEEYQLAFTVRRLRNTAVSFDWEEPLCRPVEEM